MDTNEPIFRGVEISTYLKATARIKELEELVNPKEYAVLRVLKSSMPPGASLVVCYDPGDGVPVIDDDRYEGFRVVMGAEK